MRRAGLFWQPDDSEKPEQWLAAPFEVEGEVRGARGDGWGLLLSWGDRDGRAHRWAMPHRALVGEPGAVEAELADRGLSIAPGQAQRGKLRAALAAVRCEARVRSVPRAGWQHTESGVVYVRPDGRVIGRADERVVLQAGAADAADAAADAGTLEGWQAEVAALAVGNDCLGLFLAAAFAGPLLDATGDKSGGFHLFGRSQSGKTTLLRAAASAWGVPEMGAALRSWRATANGLEATAAEACDGLLPLDEIGQADGREVAEVVYLLGNEAGKRRATRDGGARQVKTWRLVFLSTGELDLEAKLAEANKRAMAGQEVRMVSLPLPEGGPVGGDLHGHPGATALLVHLNGAVKRHHGTAAPAFLERLAAARAADPAGLAAAIENARERFLRAHLPDGADGQVSSVARRFALVAAAGRTGRRLRGAALARGRGGARGGRVLPRLAGAAARRRRRGGGGGSRGAGASLRGLARGQPVRGAGRGRRGRRGGVRGPDRQPRRLEAAGRRGAVGVPGPVHRLGQGGLRRDGPEGGRSGPQGRRAAADGKQQPADREAADRGPQSAARVPGPRRHPRRRGGRRGGGGAVIGSPLAGSARSAGPGGPVERIGAGPAGSPCASPSAPTVPLGPGAGRREAEAGSAAVSAIRAFALRFRPDPPPAPAASPAEDQAAIAAALLAFAMRPFAPAIDPEMAGTTPSVAGTGAAVGLSGAAIREACPLASSVRMVLADGAEREADLEGWLVLVRPDGRRLVLAPHAVVELERSGRLPPLPEPVDRAVGSSCARPPSWSEVEDAPEPGDRCVCGGRRWWRHVQSPQGWWCAECRPVLHPRSGTMEVETADRLHREHGAEIGPFVQELQPVDGEARGRRAGGPGGRAFRRRRRTSADHRTRGRSRCARNARARPRRHGGDWPSAPRGSRRPSPGSARRCPSRSPRRRASRWSRRDAGCRRGCGGKRWRRSLRLVQRAMTGV